MYILRIQIPEFMASWPILGRWTKTSDEKHNQKHRNVRIILDSDFPALFDLFANVDGLD
jgi:hypothetical protein